MTWLTSVFHPKDGQMVREGGDFAVLRQRAAYGVAYGRWRMFYEERQSDVVEALTRDSFAVHYWNHMRVQEDRNKEWVVKAEHPLYKIFAANCPLTEERLLRDFVGSPY